MAVKSDVSYVRMVPSSTALLRTPIATEEGLAVSIGAVPRELTITRTQLHRGIDVLRTRITPFCHADSFHYTRQRQFAESRTDEDKLTHIRNQQPTSDETKRRRSERDCYGSSSILPWRILCADGNFSHLLGDSDESVERLLRRMLCLDHLDEFHCCTKGSAV